MDTLEDNDWCGQDCLHLCRAFVGREIVAGDLAVFTLKKLVNFLEGQVEI